MPYIFIKSLPFKGPFASGPCLKAISKDFSDTMIIDKRQIIVTWNFIEAFHGAAGGEVYEFQSDSSPSVMVELVIPDSNSQERVEAMMACLANSISRNAGIDKENIFIVSRLIQSGMIFDNGQIHKW